LLADATVQGLKTKESVINALDVLENLSVDLVIIARGGGSKTDLFYLDNELIARRIAAYKYPVWTGIGHEIDMSILDHVANRYFKTPTAVAEDIVARYVEMKRHLEEGKNMLRATWTYRFDKDRTWLDEAKTGIVQGTRKLLDSTKSYLLGYATSLSSKVQNRLTNEKSRIAVSRNLIATVPVTMVKRQRERIADRNERLKSGSKRQLRNQQKDLALLRRHRFRPDRFQRRITLEIECVCDWRNRFMQMFKSNLNLKTQRLSHLSDRFKLESIISVLANERTKLTNKAATLRAADPFNQPEKGILSCIHG
jgi:exodeoxyribonuclease VII large subunit